jgi:hypothetical protein
VAGERDLARLLAGLDPRLDDRPWVFVSLAAPPPAEALMLFREDEGMTAVLAPAEARRLGLPDAPVFRRITLGIQSSLEAVGLTAAVAGALAEAGIAANVVAAYHHDHVFVPEGRADAAMQCLRRLSEGRETLGGPAV